MLLSGLYIYPVKSLRGISLSAATLDALGLAGDRRFMVVDESGRFLTQRTLPRMALIETSLSSDTLGLSSPGVGEVKIPRASDGSAPLRTVSVWSSEGLQAEDCGDVAATWLSEFLGIRCRLVRAGAAFLRPVNNPKTARPGDIVGFPDGYPLLIISEASLADLNGRLAKRGENPVPIDRFRPNLVVRGCDAFAEDSWRRFRIGDVIFRAGGFCERCTITTTNQQTAERGKEPLRTLAAYRRSAVNPSEVTFGQNLLHETKSGTLRVGDKIELSA
jgi:uncharacterized protein YcbX